MKFLTSSEVYDRLKEIIPGLPERPSKVVLKLQANEPAIFYIESFVIGEGIDEKLKFPVEKKRYKLVEY